MTVRLHRSRTLRALYVALGILCLVVGVVGIVTPLLPSTVFILAAGFFFARSSERLHAWLLSRPRLGPVVRDYQAGRGLTKRVKVIATVAIFATFGTTMALAVQSWPMRAVLGAGAVAVVWFVLSRPTNDEVEEFEAPPGG